MGRARRNLFNKGTLSVVEGMVRNGGMKKPFWLEVAQRHPPNAIPRPDRLTVPKIVLPEDRLANLFLRKEKDYPTTDTTAYEFASEQISLIENGVPEEQAYDMLIDKYRKVDTDRFVERIAQIKGRKFVPLDDVEDLPGEMASEALEHFNEGLRLEREQQAKFAAMDEAERMDEGEKVEYTN